MSTGDEQDEVLLEDDSLENTQTSNIDKILELVDELKQKDLDEYKRKINLKKHAQNGTEMEHYHDNGLHHTNFMDESISITSKNVDVVSDDCVKDTCKGLRVDPDKTEDKKTNKHFDIGESLVCNISQFNSYSIRCPGYPYKEDKNTTCGGSPAPHKRYSITCNKDLPM